jgi:predicted lipoprotein with Yx(FWY)xxD motif
MKRLLACVMGAAAIGILTAACGSGSTASSPGASATSASAAPSAAASSQASGNGQAAAAAVVNLREVAGTGKVLVDGKGRTLYLFQADTAGKSTCSGACASAWPPFTVTGTPQAGSGVDQAKLATIHRSHGTTQVVYGGHALYFYVGDSAAGEAKGQGLKAFGADWYVVAASGNKIDND